MNQNTTFKKNI